jgi:hypothetical protein
MDFYAYVVQPVLLTHGGQTGVYGDEIYNEYGYAFGFI